MEHSSSVSRKIIAAAAVVAFPATTVAGVTIASTLDDRVQASEELAAGDLIGDLTILLL